MRRMDPVEELIAVGILPSWVRAKDPERLRELLEIRRTRGLTQKESEELYLAASGESPPAEYREKFLAKLNSRIDEYERKKGTS